ncbi:hypothetical protein D3C86_1801940 [compost metagenome]
MRRPLIRVKQKRLSAIKSEGLSEFEGKPGTILPGCYSAGCMHRVIEPLLSKQCFPCLPEFHTISKACRVSSAAWNIFSGGNPAVRSYTDRCAA